MELYKQILKLSAVRKMLETVVVQHSGVLKLLGSKLSHGTSTKFADVRTHLRKVFDQDFVLNLKLLLSFYFSPNKGPNNGNQHCRKEIGDLDSFAPDEVDPYTENGGWSQLGTDSKGLVGS